MTFSDFVASLSCNISPKMLERYATIHQTYLAALLCFSSFRGFLPQVIYFLGTITVDEKLYGQREFENRAAFQRHELLCFKFKRHHYYRSLFTGSLCLCFSVASNVCDSWVFENRRVKKFTGSSGWLSNHNNGEILCVMVLLRDDLQQIT